MLSIVAIESAFVPTKDLDSKGIALQPAQNSLLASLVNATFIPHDPARTEDGYVLDAPHISTMTNQGDSIVGHSEHDQILTDAAKFLAETLQRQIFHIRTQIAPAVDNFAERLNQQLSMIEANPMAGIEVDVHGGGGIFAEAQLVESFARASEVVFQRVEMNLNLPKQDAAQIREIIRTGAPAVDEAVLKFFPVKGEELDAWLVSRWNSIFVRDASGDVAAAGLDAYISGRDAEKVATALFVFLVARRLWDAPLPETPMSAEAHESSMVLFRDQAALRLCHEYENIRRDSEAGILVRRHISGFGGVSRIEVNEGAYKTFLTTGGTNEMLLGNALRPVPYTTLQDIMAAGDELTAVWQRYYTQNEERYLQKRFSKFLEAAKVEFDYMAAESQEEEYPIPERAIARAMFVKELSCVRIDDLKDLRALALRLICRSRFYKTDGERFLASMSRVRNETNCSPQEAAGIATREYISRWIASQIRVVPVHNLAM